MFSSFFLIGNFNLKKFIGTHVWGPCLAEHIRTLLNPALIKTANYRVLHAFCKYGGGRGN